MHELSLTVSLLDIIEDYARKYDFKRLNGLKLSLGRLACVEPRSLSFAFEVQSRGTKAEGAVLEFLILPIVIYCFSCEREAELDVYESVCPLCGGENVLLVGGTEELKVLELDVD